MESKTQIFGTDSPRRWQRIKWASRIILVGGIVALAVLLVSVFDPNRPALPALFNKYVDYKKAIQNDTLSLEHSSVVGTNGYKFDKYGRGLGRMHNKIKPLSKRAALPFDKRLRAGFYVNWDLQSFYSLRDNVDKMNVVLPEWLHVGDNCDTIVEDIDRRALDFLSLHPTVQVVPMITNYFNDKWNGANVQRIIHDPARRKVFIQSVLNVLHKYHFQGVNIDFESLDDEKTNVYLTEFQKELYTALHTEGYIVSQDVNALSEDYDLPELAKVNDQLYIMAYDLHNDQSDAGDIAPQKWVENIINQVTAKVPPEKLVLCLAGYGYDWGEKGKIANDITFQEAIAIAKESSATIDFDNDTYGLNFKYSDDKDIEHRVYFTDAATNFNNIRVADDAGWRGVALWRLGSEDPRLWSFYDKDLSFNALQNGSFDIQQIKSSLIADNVDYVGEGEILDVLSEPKDGVVKIEFDNAEKVISEENYIELPTSYVVRKFGKSLKKQIVLTFDDGPDPEYTPQILDILKREKVPAAFFVVGKAAEENLPLLRRLYTEGYEIGNHSFTHPNMANVSEWRANLELNATRRLIESITGRSTLMFRPPYAADAEPETREELQPVVLAKKQNYLTVGESIDPLDWDTERGVNADSIVARCIREQTYGSMILLHDAGGDRSATVEALPRIIKYFHDNGYTFTTVADLMGKTRDDLMPLVPPKQAFLDNADSILATTVYWIQRILGGIFTIAIGLAMLRILFVLTLAVLQKRKENALNNFSSTSVNPELNKNKVSLTKHESVFDSQTESLTKHDLYSVSENPIALPQLTMQHKTVSIIVPAFNEEVTAVKSVASLLLQNYPDFDIIFIDDGSRDATFDVVKNAFLNNPKVKVLTKPNGGKASALNFGIAQASGEFVVCIDADTQLSADAVQNLMKKFHDANVAAVAGNVKVGNTVNLLTRWQSIEYVTAQNFDRMAFGYLNAITVVPGAIGAFRKSVVEELGGFSTDTLAEDCDLTMRILRGGWKVTTANDAIAVTEAPETFGQFQKQRFRWSFGVMQAFWKNRDTLFNSKFGALGWVAMPNILLFQFILPLFAPIADVILLFGLLTGSTHSTVKLLTFYLAFMLIDLICSVVAFRFEGERPLSKLWLLFPQRLVYRPLMYAVLFKSYRRAFKGELQNWGVLKRTGNAQKVQTA